MFFFRTTWGKFKGTQINMELQLTQIIIATWLVIKKRERE